MEFSRRAWLCFAAGASAGLNGQSLFNEFTLELDFRISKGGNSGVFIRQPLRPFSASGDGRPGQRPDDGVEIRIDYNDPKNLTGSVYNLQKATPVPGGEERWNRFRIECSGSRVKMLLGGEWVNDYGALKSPKGAIGLQIHGGRPHDHVVRFRNLVLI